MQVCLIGEFICNILGVCVCVCGFFEYFTYVVLYGVYLEGTDCVSSICVFSCRMK